MKIDDVFEYVDAGTVGVGNMPNTFYVRPKKKKKKKKEMKNRKPHEKVIEGLSPVLYHATSIEGFFGMMRTNKIRLSKNPMKKGTYYMSFSRNRTNDFISYLNSLRDYELDEEGFNPRRDAYVVVEFDGRALGQNYSGKAFNTFNPEGDEEDEDDVYPDFMEDRLYNNKPFIPNANRYLKSVSLVLNDEDLSNSELVELLERFGSNLRMYDDTRSYMSGRMSERNYNQ